MVSKEDYEEIIKNAKKVLFMGDRNQLPPVEESKSLAFVGSPNYELKKVMRYSGHILSECNKLRKGVETNRIVPIESDEKQIIRLNLEEAISKATELFMSKDFENDSTFCRIVAYRNDIVERNNKLIKPKVYGTDDDYFKGLKLIASKPVVRRNTHDKRKWDIYCNTSEEVKIISDPEILEIDEDLLANMPRNCEELDGLKNVGNVIRFECLSEGGITFKALILDEKATFNKENVTEDIQNKLQKEQKLIEKTKKIIQEKDDKLMEMSDSEETRSKEELEIIEKEEDNLCKELFNLEKEIEIIEESVKKFKRALFFLNRWGDDLKDIFCSTVHKAQGSTYKHVFVELKDILTPPRNRGKKIRRPDDRPKLLYTAVSRASEKVYLID